MPLEEICLTLRAGVIASGSLANIAGASAFLQSAPQPPPLESVATAIGLLRDIGALAAPLSAASSAGAARSVTSSLINPIAGGAPGAFAPRGGTSQALLEAACDDSRLELTALGKHLSRLPVHPRIGKMLVRHCKRQLAMKIKS